MLPKAVMLKAQQEFLNWQNMGVSVMEISHRSHNFLELVERAETNLRQLLSIPENYHVLYMQGGARGQFSAVPLNLLGEKNTANYINSGYWSRSAISEASKYCVPNDLNVLIKNEGELSVLPSSQWVLNEDAAYVHFCPNETIDGVEIRELPETDLPIVADMSSTILSRPLDVEKYGVIYAGAQKNIGPAGLTLAIVRDDLLGQAHKMTPSILDYTVLAKSESMFNTPPTFAWYLAGEVYQWLLDQGGLLEIEKKNQHKAALLYQAIDGSNLYINKVHQGNRSIMNVPFQLKDPQLDDAFLQHAEKSGLVALKGHRDAGGIRASIYNAMPIEGVKALVDFMGKFEKEHGY